MSDDPAPAPESERASLRNKERIALQKRRDLVARLRYAELLPLSKIVERLARLTPPIIVDVAQVSRDLSKVKMEMRREFNAKRFDALGYIAARVSSYDHVAQIALRSFRRAKEPSDKNAFLRTYLQATKQADELLQDAGLVDRRIGTLYIDDESKKKAERIPSGDEMQKFFDRVEVKEGEIVSEAERAWLFGDAAAVDSEGKDHGEHHAERKQLPAPAGDGAEDVREGSAAVPPAPKPEDA